MSSVLSRNLNLFTTPTGEGQLWAEAAPTRATSLVTWIGDKGLVLHLSGPPAEELIYACDAPAQAGYGEYGLILHLDAVGSFSLAQSHSPRSCLMHRIFLNVYLIEPNLIKKRLTL